MRCCGALQFLVALAAMVDVFLAASQHEVHHARELVGNRGFLLEVSTLRQPLAGAAVLFRASGCSYRRRAGRPQSPPSHDSRVFNAEVSSFLSQGGSRRNCRRFRQCGVAESCDTPAGDRWTTHNAPRQASKVAANRARRRPPKCARRQYTDRDPVCVRPQDRWPYVQAQTSFRDLLSRVGARTPRARRCVSRVSCVPRRDRARCGRATAARGARAPAAPRVVAVGSNGASG